MRTLSLIVLIVVSPLLVGMKSTQGQTDPRVEQLGPEDDYSVPKDLTALVNVAQASVVARIVSLGEFRWADSTDKRGVLLAWDGFVTYRVVLADVLYDKLKGTAPELARDMQVELTQRVGRQGAEAFFSKNVPVAPGDECLLFLWHRPRAAEWSILQWPLQFRKSARIIDAAEPIVPLPNGLALSRQEWLGPGVSVAPDGKAVAPNWIGLKEEVRRLGTLQKKL